MRKQMTIETKEEEQKKLYKLTYNKLVPNYLVTKKEKFKPLSVLTTPNVLSPIAFGEAFHGISESIKDSFIESFYDINDVMKAIITISNPFKFKVFKADDTIEDDMISKVPDVFMDIPHMSETNTFNLVGRVCINSDRILIRFDDNFNSKHYATPKDVYHVLYIQFDISKLNPDDKIGLEVKRIFNRLYNLFEMIVNSKSSYLVNEFGQSYLSVINEMCATVSSMADDDVITFTSAMEYLDELSITPITKIIGHDTRNTNNVEVVDINNNGQIVSMR